MVGHEDHGFSFFAEPLYQVQQLFALFYGKAGSGFVEDQNVGAQTQGAGDLHHLLVGDAHALNDLRNVHFDAQRGQDLLGVYPHTFPINTGNDPRLYLADTKVNVLRHRELGDQVQLLRHQSDAQMDRIRGAVQLYFFTVNRNRSNIRLDLA